MRIFLTGATGLVGRALVKALQQEGHEISALSRNPQQAAQRLPGVNIVSSLDNYQSFDGIDAVINLAGEPIFDKRWSAEQKQRLQQSRVELTQHLSRIINQSARPPHCFISGSATGIYGDQGEERIDESTQPGTQFPAELCLQWEQAAQQADTRVCLLRTGMVLSQEGGALAKMLPLYRFALGGKLGGGNQYWAWIHRQDMVNAIVFLLHNPSCRGAFNMTSPNPEKNAEFNRTLAYLLHRPAFCHAPKFALDCLLGERAQLLTDSQRVVPQKLQAAGFAFRYPQLQSALDNLIHHQGG